jgi:hypothetical protein
VAAIGATLAFIIVQTTPIENTFPPPNLSINIIEGNNIKNKGDVPVYVRAAVVVNWVEKNPEEGKQPAILSEQPVVGTDYTMTVNNTDWFLGSDGFYYCKAPLLVGTTAPPTGGHCNDPNRKDRLHPAGAGAGFGYSDYTH